MNLTTEMLMHFAGNSEGEECGMLLMEIIPMLTPRQMKMLEVMFKYKMVFVGSQEDQPDEDDEQEEPDEPDEDELEIPRELR